MRHSERSGILLALAGCTILAIGDAVVKTMSGEWSPIAVAALRFVMGAVALSAWLWLREGAASFRPPKFWLQFARGACLALATICFFSAIYLMPLAEAISVAFIAPLLTALFSGPLLGEKVQPKVWLASFIALAGVAIVLRPNLLELGIAALLPLGSALFFSLMVIANRASAGLGSTLAMQAYIAVFAAPILVLAAIAGHFSGEPTLAAGWPDWSVIARCAFVAVTASTAH